jgi:transposase
MKNELIKEFVGIDVSKLTLDVHLHVKNLHCVFSNDSKGHLSMFSWIRKQCRKNEELRFCFEHTGIYSLELAVFLKKHDQVIYIVSGLAIKRSMGLKRGKSDNTDAKEIAKYIFQNHYTLKPTELASDAIQELQMHISFRSNLVKKLASFKMHRKEFGKINESKGYDQIEQVTAEIMETLKKGIKDIEKQIQEIIYSDEALKNTFENISSIKGVGPILAGTMIVITRNFTLFETSRQLACYAGIVPFEHSSGTSYRGKNRISSLGNRDLKSLLTMAAISSITHNPELKIYYQRRISEGKSKMSTINVVRNKLVSRIFAVANRNSKYVEIYKFAS